MARRSFSRVTDGQPYCVEWPEWMVHCRDCGQSAVMADLGQAYSVKEAEEVFEKSGRREEEGFRKIRGRWVCQECFVKKGRNLK